MTLRSILLFFLIVVLPVIPGNAQEQGTESGAGADTLATVEEKPDTLLYQRPRFEYDSRGKRDPFRTLAPREQNEAETKIKELFEYEDAKVLGIVESEDDAYALMVDSNNLSFVLREGDRVLGGYVTRVSNGGVVLNIVKYGRAMTIVMRLESSKYTVIEEKDGASIVRKPGINLTYEQGVPGTKKVLIEEVTIPSTSIRTVEEEWFGPEETIFTQLGQETESDVPVESGGFSLVAPQDNSWINLPFLFDWTTLEDEDISYTLVLDDDGDFSSPILQKEGIKTSSFLVNDTMNIPSNKAVYWKIIAVDMSGKRYEPVKSDMSFKIIGKK